MPLFVMHATGQGGYVSHMPLITCAIAAQPLHICRWATSRREEGNAAIIDHGW